MDSLLPQNSHLTIGITPQDMPFCYPLINETVWNRHPRVYLATDRTGKTRCPYCSTVYQLTGKRIFKHD